MAYLTILQDELELKHVELIGPITIGRLPAVCDLVSRDSKVSRRHCRIEPAPDGWLLTDLQSSNGTWVNGSARQQSRLRDGDEVQIGDTVLRFRDSAMVRRRPADPTHALALLLARAGQHSGDGDDFGELAPRPIPRAWDRLNDSGDSSGLSDTRA
jgi:predicted component of type VI protein secretion system